MIAGAAERTSIQKIFYLRSDCHCRRIDETRKTTIQNEIEHCDNDLLRSASFIAPSMFSVHIARNCVAWRDCSYEDEHRLAVRSASLRQHTNTRTRTLRRWRPYCLWSHNTPHTTLTCYMLSSALLWYDGLGSRITSLAHVHKAMHNIIVHECLCHRHRKRNMERQHARPSTSNANGPREHTHTHQPTMCSCCQLSMALIYATLCCWCCCCCYYWWAHNQA